MNHRINIKFKNCIFKHLPFSKKKTIDTYLKQEICVVFREFIVFSKQSDDYLYLYIRNLEHSRLKPGFRYTISICICVSRYKIINGYCSRKTVLNAHYSRFLMYKSIFVSLFFRFNV